MFVLVDGVGPCGKSVLTSLLDGHSELFVTPFHDMVMDGLCDAPETWAKVRDLMGIREVLATTHYYQFEWWAARGYLEIQTSAGQMVRHPFDFDFYGFDSAWPTALKRHSTWDVRGVSEEIFRAMLGATRAYDSRRRPVRHFVGMGFDRPGMPESFFRHHHDGKILYVRRPVEEIVAVVASRKPTLNDPRSYCLDEATVDRLLSSGYPGRVAHRLRRMREAAERWPERVKIVEFAELALSPERVMRSVCDFLEIAHEPALSAPTVLGQPLTIEGEGSYVGRIFDRADLLLTPSERLAIEVSTTSRSIFAPGRWRNPTIAAGAAAKLSRAWLSRQGRRLGAIVDAARSRNPEWQRNGFF